MPLPTTFIEHLKSYGYHPRSDRHSNSLALAIVGDLLSVCPRLKSKAEGGEVVFDLNRDLRVRTAIWNVDLVLGTPAQIAAPKEGLIARAPPATVEIAVEIKSIMTEHRKAVKNRKRDLEAHHEHTRNYSQTAVSAGVFVINGSQTFTSPLRAGVVTTHAIDAQRMRHLVEHCLNELRNVGERSNPSGYGMDAKCAIVVEMDNVQLETTRYAERLPAPQAGDPLNYDSFLQRICNAYNQRFS